MIDIESTASMRHAKHKKLHHWTVLLLMLLAVQGFSGCANVLALQPKGLAAERIAELWWFQFFLALPFFLVVVILLLLAARRRAGQSNMQPRNHGMIMVIWGGMILPAFVTVALMAFTINTLVAVTEPADRTELSIEVHGELWWWKVGYSDGGEVFYTANEIHIPAGEPVALELKSSNVIHSFWVPELHGKRDMIPGIPSAFWIQADHPGVFQGVCAEFCGAQHAKMHFLVIAHEPEGFEQWFEHERQPDQLLTEEDENFAGQQAFLDTGCGSCHTIRGTTASGILGPDLTHVASRQDLAAGTLSNVTGNLAAWIINSQHFKPGNLMPPTQLQADDLQAIVGYLQSLQ